MIKYRCQLCGRIHYGRTGLKPGYCTTCGPRGGLILDIDWKTINALATIVDDARKTFSQLAIAGAAVNILGFKW